MVYIESIVSQWQSRVGKGKIVANFGKQVENLIQTVQDRFRDRTLGSLVAKQRAERAKKLSDAMRSAIESLYRQQLDIIYLAAKANFIKSLRSLATADMSKLTPDKTQQLLRQQLFDFQMKMDELDVPSYKFSSNIEVIKSELTDELKDTLAGFPESNAARVEALRKLDQQVRKPQPKQGRAVNVAFTLVGMFRPPGFGNLQGYLNHATSIAGYPMNFLFGVQNDGDAPEVSVYPSHDLT
jgi:hypothetical protein